MYYYYYYYYYYYEAFFYSALTSFSGLYRNVSPTAVFPERKSLTGVVFIEGKDCIISAEEDEQFVRREDLFPPSVFFWLQSVDLPVHGFFKKKVSTKHNDCRSREMNSLYQSDNV